MATFKDLRKLAKKMIELATKAVEDPKLANRIKNSIVLNIRKNSTLPSGQQVKPVSDQWKRYRSNLSSANRTSRYWSQHGSNMTFTGQFLSSFVGTIKKIGRAVKITIAPTGIHKGYNLLEGDKSGNVLNADIGKGFIARGDDYTVVSDELKKEMVKSVKARILKEFKLNLK